MATLTIPVRSDLQAYSFTIELDGAVYLLRFRYNTRLARWIMDIAGTDGVNVVAGVPLLTNCDLIDRYTMRGLPPGKFLAYDESGDAANAELADLGNPIVLLYQEAGS